MITGGKWKSSVSKNGRLQISGENGAQVCSMWNCKQRDSNAALISAAPDMYDLLSEVSKLIDMDGMSAIQWIMDNHCDVRRLLKKARGEE